MKESGIDWIGQIPEEWYLGKVKFFSKISAGATPDRNNIFFWNGDINWMSSGEVNQEVVTHTAETITTLALKRTSTKLLPIGTVMLALNGQGKTKGTAAVLAIETASNQSLASFIVDNAKVNNIYLYYFLKANYSNIRGLKGEDRDGLNLQLVSNIIIPLLDIKEQQKIADFLDKKTAQLDKAKALLEEQIRKLKDYRASLIYETVTKGLDKTVPLKDSGIDWIGQVPEGWGVTKIKNIVNIERGASPRPIDKFISDDGTGVNWIRIGDTHKGIKYITSTKLKITNRGKQYSRYIHPGTLILSNSMSFGEPYISSIYGCIHDGWLSLAPFNNISKEYLYWLLLSDVCTSQFNLVSIGAVVENLSVDKVGNTLIPMPYSLSEQTKISDFLDKKTVQIDQLIQIKNKQIDNINKQRQTLIYDYVTGKRRV